MRLLCVVLAAFGCRAPHAEPITSRVEPRPEPHPLDPAISLAERCAMVEAVFAVPEFRKFACGESATREGRTVVDVKMRTPFAANETCNSAVFSIYRLGEPTNTDAVVQVSIGPDDAARWQFSASFFDPPNSPDDQPTEDGGFEHATYYCGFGFGRLERTSTGWRGWVDWKQ